jgi:hypothetical protein
MVSGEEGPEWPLFAGLEWGSRKKRVGDNPGRIAGTGAIAGRPARCIGWPSQRSNDQYSLKSSQQNAMIGVEIERDDSYQKTLKLLLE